MLVSRSIGTRLGEGLRSSGRLGDDAMARTLEVVVAHAAAIDPAIGRTYAIATSAMRRASNGGAFADRVAATLGVDLHVLTGEEEAIASYRGAIAGGHASEGLTGVVDVGGGSTEYAVGFSTIPLQVASCEIGAVRLTELHGGLAGVAGAVDRDVVERARALTRRLLSPLAAFPGVERLIVVGGSATTAAALLHGDRTGVARVDVRRDQIAATLDRLISIPLAQRKVLPGMNPQRADILPAGLIVIDELLALAGQERATVASADLLLGYLLIRAESDSFRP